MAPRVRRVHTLSKDIGLGNVKSHFLKSSKVAEVRRSKFVESSVKASEEYLHGKLKPSRNPSPQKVDGNTHDDTRDATRQDRNTAQMAHTPQPQFEVQDNLSQ